MQCNDQSVRVHEDLDLDVMMDLTKASDLSSPLLVKLSRVLERCGQETTAVEASG